MACSAPTESPDSEPSSDESEIVTAKQKCSKEAYDKAFVSYKLAVDGAKLRGRGDVCGEGTMLHSIASNLHAAVTTCSQFKTIVATSKWAQPVRDALKDNLTLASFDGRITVKDATGKVTLAGLDKALTGVTLFGPAPGIYGNMSSITFAANGSATIGTLEVPDDGEPTWKTAPARYTLSGLELSVIAAGKTTVYTVALDADGYEIILRPKTGGDDFRSMPSECEA